MFDVETFCRHRYLHQKNILEARQPWRALSLGRKNFIDADSCVKDAPRHFDKDEAPDIEADLEEAACWVLVRACENAHRLGLTVQGTDALNDWFYEHIVGVWSVLLREIFPRLGSSTAIVAYTVLARCP